MRPRETYSFRTILMLALMGALALAALISLSGCGGGGDGAAPTGVTVRGRVVDDRNEPISGARVKLLPVGTTVSTGADGRFSVAFSANLPERVTIDPSTIGNTYLRYFTYRGRTFEIGCDLGPAIPAPSGGVVDLGDILIYRQDSVPPPPGETCP